MADSFVRVPPDSTGKLVETKSLNDGVQVVERQVIAVGDPTDAERFMAVNADGSINTALPDVTYSAWSTLQASTKLSFLYDDFPGVALDTANKWDVITAAGTGVTVSVTGGALVIGAGTSAAAGYAIRSKQGFKGDCELFFMFRLSQRLAANNFYLSLENAAGTSYAHIRLTGTTGTNADYLTANASVAGLTATTTITNTNATSGVGVTRRGAMIAFFNTVGVGTGNQKLMRNLQSFNVPDVGEELFVVIRSTNGAAPATNTNLTVENVYCVEDNTAKVTVNGFEILSANASPLSSDVIGVYFPNTPTISGSVTATGITGTVAHDGIGTSNPVRAAGRAHTTAQTAVADGDTCNMVTTTVGAQIVRPYCIPELDWSYAAASGGIANTTTAVTIKASAGGSIRNYITAIQISSDALGAATELAIHDGAAGTVLWRMKIGTAGIINGISIEFPTPLRGTAATLLEVVTLTASITGAVFFNAQGYTAP